VTLTHRFLLGLIAASGMAAATIAAPALAQEASFEGKRMTVFIGYSPTGGIGYDTYGRLMARFIGKYLPGNPSVQPANKPGGGSMTLANYIAHVAPKDGTEIGIVGRGVPMDRLVFGETSTAKFDATKAHWLGSMNNEVSGVYISDTAPVKTLDEMLAGKPMAVGSAGAASDLHIFAIVMNQVLGTKFKLISGYPGTTEILLAMEKGEVDGLVGYSWGAARTGSAEMLKTGKLKNLMQLGLKKHADLPNLPLIMDMVKNEDDKKVLELVFARQSAGRPFMAPPEVNAPTVATLRKAFTAAMKDPELIAMAQKMQLEIDYVSGEEVQALVEKVHGFPPEIISRTQKMASGK
jgi:tripartite-type tricarboxylate transporter receptor subunit TctC